MSTKILVYIYILTKHNIPLFSYFIYICVSARLISKIPEANLTIKQCLNICMRLDSYSNKHIYLFFILNVMHKLYIYVPTARSIIIWHCQIVNIEFSFLIFDFHFERALNQRLVKSIAFFIIITIIVFKLFVF